MPNVRRGERSGRGLAFAIAVARFNEYVTGRLLDGALQGLREHNVADAKIDVAWVPGSLELPLTAKRLAQTGRYAAVICLGAVIRGDTDHYEHVSTQSIAGAVQAGLETGVPVIVGILTTDTVEQALERTGGKEGNKGYDAAVAALEMAGLLKALKRGQTGF